MFLSKKISYCLNFVSVRFLVMLSRVYEEIPAIITIEEPMTIGQVKLSLNTITPIMAANTRWK